MKTDTKAPKVLTQEEKDFLTQRAEKYILMAYILYTGADIILRRSGRIMNALKPHTRYKDAWEIGKNIKALEQILKTSEIRFEKMDYDFAKELGGDFLDTLRSNANEVLRFVMAFYDRTYENRENTARVNELFGELESSGFFTDEEIADIKMG